MSGELLLVLRFLMAASLYGFLGLALYTLWKDLKRQSEQASRDAAPPITLRNGKGEREFHFTQSQVTIGRDPACDCTIVDKTVSTRHALLSYHHNQWWVEDMNSTNGTYLNQEPVTTPLVITNGDQMRCGQVVFDISVDSVRVEK